MRGGAKGPPESSKTVCSCRQQKAADDEVISIQPMSTLVEQQLYLLCDVIALEIMKRNGWTEETVKNHHANLE